MLLIFFENPAFFSLEVNLPRKDFKKFFVVRYMGQWRTDKKKYRSTNEKRYAETSVSELFKQSLCKNEALHKIRA